MKYWFLIVLTAAGIFLWRLPVPAKVPQPVPAETLRFESNVGQTGNDVRFLSRAPGYLLLLKSSEADFVAGRSRESAVRLQLRTTNPNPDIEGLEPLQAKSYYLTGRDPSDWHTDIPNYAKVRYRNVYPGIDLVFYGNHGKLEYDFIVSAGSDPTAIEMDVAAGRASIAESGDLLAKTGDTAITLHAPLVYQEVGSAKRRIPASFALDGSHIRFQIGSFDHNLPMIVDPVVDFSTLLGGSVGQFGNAIAVDAPGNVYVTGQTFSLNFPTSNPIPGAAGSDCLPGGTQCADAYVTKLSSDGQTILFSTTIGGSGNDAGNAIAVDASGNIYVTGSTNSQDFPVVNALQSTIPQGQGSAFVLKIAATGSKLIYSTYFPGGGADIAVDGAGNAYVVGSVDTSPCAVNGVACPLPVISSLRPPSGGDDAFAAKLDPSGNPVYATYLGGSMSDSGLAITVDLQGNAYVGGSTDSTDFPATPSAFQTTWNPGSCLNGLSILQTKPCDDGFIAKLNPSGTLLFATYLGGNGEDTVAAIAVDSVSNIYVTGATGSTNFPAQNISQTPNVTGGFVTKLQPNLSGLVYSALLGGIGTSIALDTTASAVVGGDAGTIPLVDAVQLGPTSGGFVAKVTPAGDAFTFSSYVGSDLSQVTGVAVASDDSISITGTIQWQRPDFFTYKALQPVLTSTGNDAFVMKLSPGVSETIYAMLSDAAKAWFMGSGGTSASVGFATLSYGVESAPTSGVAIYDQTVNGVLISETGVPASPAILSGRIDAENGGAVITGIAIANPNSVPATIGFYFTDSQGNNFAPGQWTVPANGQIANFLNSLLANTTTVPATFSFTSSEPVGVVALRGYLNQRSEFLTSTLEVAQPGSTSTSVTTIPQFADGGGWTSELILVNPTDSTLTGSISFFGHGTSGTAAAVLSVPVSGTMTSTSYAYNIAPRSSARFQTLGQSASVQTGSVQIAPAGGSLAPVGEGLFGFQDSSGVLASQVGAPAENPSPAFRLFAETAGIWGQVGSMQTGIAVTNGSNQSINVQLELFAYYGPTEESYGGALEGPTTIVLPPGGQSALFLNEIPGWSNVGTMQGLLRVTTNSAPGVTVIGLRGRYNQRGDFLMATLPALDETLLLPTGPLIFPDLVMGGGYTTEVALYSASSTQLSFGQLMGFTQAGVPMNTNGQ